MLDTRVIGELVRGQPGLKAMLTPPPLSPMSPKNQKARYGGAHL